MDVTTIKTETIIIHNPSERLKSLIEKARARKMACREEMRSVQPMFTIKASE